MVTFHDTLKLYDIQISMSINRVILGHVHTPLFCWIFFNTVRVVHFETLHGEQDFWSFTKRIETSALVNKGTSNEKESDDLILQTSVVRLYCQEIYIRKEFQNDLYANSVSMFKHNLVSLFKVILYSVITALIFVE